MNEKIIIAPVDLKHQRISKCYYLYFVFFKTHIQYAGKFIAEEIQLDEQGLPEEYKGWKEGVPNNFELNILKSFLSGADLYYIEELDIWQVKITCYGRADDVMVHFKTKEAATVFLEKVKYFLGMI